MPFANPPVIPDAPADDASDGITFGDASTEIPGDVAFSDTGTTGLAQAPDAGEQTDDDSGAGTSLASASLLGIAAPVILLGALGW